MQCGLSEDKLKWDIIYLSVVAGVDPGGMYGGQWPCAYMKSKQNKSLTEITYTNGK